MATPSPYYYDKDTARFIRVDADLGTRIRYISRVVFLSTGLAILMVVIYSACFDLPGELILKAEISGLVRDFDKMDAELNSLRSVMSSIEKRDDQVYRVALGVEPVDKSIRAGGVGGTDRYDLLRQKEVKYGEMMASLHTKISKLRRKLYVESVSQDELIFLGLEKRKQFAAIPAIQPLANKQLTALASGFGLRLHPVYRLVRMHTGIDFSCAPGTPVYATADGQVIAVDTAVSGYGRMVIIDHGYGYQTRYGHLRDFKVKLGDHVRRGVPIALSGNTGVSTAPHLHYEVLLNGIQINPVQYFFSDLTSTEYEKIVRLASVQNQSLGN